MEELLDSISPGRVHRPQGTAVYLTAFSGNAPNCLLHNLKHNEVLHEHVVLLTVEVPDEPYVAAGPARRRSSISARACTGSCCATASWSSPTCRATSPSWPTGRAVRSDAHLLLHRPQQLRRRRRPLLPRWQQKLFLVLARFAASAGDFFGLPANRVVELGSRIEI